MTTVVCVASGPSRTPEQAALVERARAAGKCHVIVCNRAWEALPNADVLYAADEPWWTAPEFGQRALAEFAGECWTVSAAAARRFGLCLAQITSKPGASRQPFVLHSGSNGGYQLLGLARHFLMRDPDPQKRIILVGYDMQHTGGRRHCHEDYPSRIVVEGKSLSFGNSNSVRSWAKNFPALAADLAAEGIEAINCTTHTALTCFRRGDLREVLEAA